MRCTCYFCHEAMQCIGALQKTIFSSPVSLEEAWQILTRCACQNLCSWFLAHLSEKLLRTRERLHSEHSILFTVVHSQVVCFTWRTGVAVMRTRPGYRPICRTLSTDSFMHGLFTLANTGFWVHQTLFLYYVHHVLASFSPALFRGFVHMCSSVGFFLVSHSLLPLDTSIHICDGHSFGKRLDIEQTSIYIVLNEEHFVRYDKLMTDCHPCCCLNPLVHWA